MGFFSWECSYCGRSILSNSALETFPEIADKKWLTQSVFMYADGSRFIGEYDGYGRVEGRSMEEYYLNNQEPCAYHKDCWDHLGKPDYDYSSCNACDQGFFLDDIEYYVNCKSPKED